MSAARLAGALRDESTRILTNWSMRIATLPFFRALPEINLEDLQRDMPQLLDAILLAVRLSPYDYDRAPLELAGHLATVHGGERAHSYPLDVVLSEIQALQREVRNALWRCAGETPAEVVSEVETHLNDIFEQVIRSSAMGWVDCRHFAPIVDGQAA
jgi:hypothetical protein